MKTMFYFLLFMVLFNIAAVTIAVTGFFGSDVLYGDLVSDDPTKLIEPEQVLENLWFNPVDDALPTFTVAGIDLITFNWVTVTIGLFVIALFIGRVMHATPSVLAVAMVGSILLLMYSNSKKIFETMVGSMDSVALYVSLMVGVAFMFIVIITIMDYLSGQDSASGR